MRLPTNFVLAPYHGLVRAGGQCVVAIIASISSIFISEATSALIYLLPARLATIEAAERVNATAQWLLAVSAKASAMARVSYVIWVHGPDAVTIDAPACGPALHVADTPYILFNDSTRTTPTRTAPGHAFSFKCMFDEIVEGLGCYFVTYSFLTTMAILLAISVCITFWALNDNPKPGYAFPTIEDPQAPTPTLPIARHIRAIRTRRQQVEHHATCLECQNVILDVSMAADQPELLPSSPTVILAIRSDTDSPPCHPRPPVTLPERGEILIAPSDSPTLLSTPSGQPVNKDIPPLPQLGDTVEPLSNSTSFSVPPQPANPRLQLPSPVSPLPKVQPSPPFPPPPTTLRSCAAAEFPSVDVSPRAVPWVPFTMMPSQASSPPHLPPESPRTPFTSFLDPPVVGADRSRARRFSLAPGSHLSPRTMEGRGSAPVLPGRKGLPGVAGRPLMELILETLAQVKTMAKPVDEP